MHVAPTILTGKRFISLKTGECFARGAAVDLEHDVGRNEDDRTVFIPEILIPLERFRWKIVLCGRGTSAVSRRNSSVR